MRGIKIKIPISRVRIFREISFLRACDCFNSTVLVIRNSLELRTTRHQLNLFALRKFKSPRYPFVFETQSQFAWLMQRQFTLHLHFVFNRNECAQPECGVFFTTSSPHARCLTLTLAPNGAGAGCSLVRECRGQQPFRYPRVRRTRHHARTLLFQITVALTPYVTARVRHQCQPLSRIY